jgi:hypothetical protein
LSAFVSCGQHLLEVKSNRRPALKGQIAFVPLAGV